MGSTSASSKLECAEWGTERSFYSVKENGREPAADAGGGGPDDRLAKWRAWYRARHTAH